LIGFIESEIKKKQQKKGAKRMDEKARSSPIHEEDENREPSSSQQQPQHQQQIIHTDQFEVSESKGPQNEYSGMKSVQEMLIYHQKLLTNNKWAFSYIGQASDNWKSHLSTLLKIYESRAFVVQLRIASTVHERSTMTLLVPLQVLSYLEYALTIKPPTTKKVVWESDEFTVRSISHLRYTTLNGILEPLECTDPPLQINDLVESFTTSVIQAPADQKGRRIKEYLPRLDLWKHFETFLAPFNEPLYNLFQQKYTFVHILNNKWGEINNLLNAIVAVLKDPIKAYDASKNSSSKGSVYWYPTQEALHAEVVEQKRQQALTEYHQLCPSIPIHEIQDLKFEALINRLQMLKRTMNHRSQKGTPTDKHRKLASMKSSLTNSTYNSTKSPTTPLSTTSSSLTFAYPPHVMTSPQSPLPTTFSPSSASTPITQTASDPNSHDHTASSSVSNFPEDSHSKNIESLEQTSLPHSENKKSPSLKEVLLVLQEVPGVQQEQKMESSQNDNNDRATGMTVKKPTDQRILPTAMQLAPFASETMSSAETIPSPETILATELETTSAQVEDQQNESANNNDDATTATTESFSTLDTREEIAGVRDSPDNHSEQQTNRTRTNTNDSKVSIHTPEKSLVVDDKETETEDNEEAVIVVQPTLLPSVYDSTTKNIAKHPKVKVPQNSPTTTAEYPINSLTTTKTKANSKTNSKTNPSQSEKTFAITNSVQKPNLPTASTTTAAPTTAAAPTAAVAPTTAAAPSTTPLPVFHHHGVVRKTRTPPNYKMLHPPPLSSSPGSTTMTTMSTSSSPPTPLPSQSSASSTSAPHTPNPIISQYNSTGNGTHNHRIPSAGTSPVFLSTVKSTTATNTNTTTTSRSPPASHVISGTTSAAIISPTASLASYHFSGSGLTTTNSSIIAPTTTTTIPTTNGVRVNKNRHPRQHPYSQSASSFPPID
jgi:hypothetical protein